MRLGKLCNKRNNFSGYIASSAQWFAPLVLKQKSNPSQGQELFLAQWLLMLMLMTKRRWQSLRFSLEHLNNSILIMLQESLETSPCVWTRWNITDSGLKPKGTSPNVARDTNPGTVMWVLLVLDYSRVWAQMRHLPPGCVSLALLLYVCKACHV